MKSVNSPDGFCHICEECSVYFVSIISIKLAFLNYTYHRKCVNTKLCKIILEGTKMNSFLESASCKSIRNSF